MSINSVYYNPYMYSNLYGTNGSTDTQSTTTIPLMQNTVATQETTQSTAKDGKDDGKISLFSKIGNAVKGVGKAIGGAVCSIVPGASHLAKALGWKDAPAFSLKNAALAVGAVAVGIVCPPAGVAIAAAGVATGAVQVGKGIYAATTASTDAEAEAAWQNIGGGTFQAAVSAVGVKAGLKACGNTSAALSKTASESGGILAKAKNVGSSFAKDAKVSLKNNTTLGKNVINSLDDADKGLLNKGKAIKEGVKTTYDESALGKNIASQEGGKVSRTIKGTAKTASEKAANLKQKGYQAIDDAANTSKANLNKALDKLDDASEIKGMKLETADDIANFQKALDKLDDSALDATTKSDLSKLAKQAEKAQAKIDKYTLKENVTNETKTKILDELKKQYDEGKIPEEKYNAAVEKLQNYEYKKGSLTQGAKEEVSNWAKKTMEKNAKTAADQYNKAMKEAGFTNEKINTSNIKSDISDTKREIAKTKEKIAEAKKAVKEAEKGDAAKAAKTTLTEAETKLNKLKTKLGIQNQYESALYGTNSKLESLKYTSGYTLPVAANNLKTDNVADNSQVANYQQEAYTPTNYQYAELPELSYNSSTGMWA